MGIGILAGLSVPLLMFLYARAPSGRRLVLTCVLALVALSAKTVLRFGMRASRLEGVSDPVIAPTIQIGPIVLFGLCFVIAVVVIVWLLRLASPTSSQETV